MKIENKSNYELPIVFLLLIVFVISIATIFLQHKTEDTENRVNVIEQNINK